MGFQREYYLDWPTGTVTVMVSDGYTLVAEVKSIRGGASWTLITYEPLKYELFPTYTAALTEYYNRESMKKEK